MLKSEELLRTPIYLRTTASVRARNVRVRIKGSEMLVFQKILRTY